MSLILSLVMFLFSPSDSVSFTGHRGGVSSLCWDAQGMRVASGSDDGEIVLWDVVSHLHRSRVSNYTLFF